VETTNDLSLDNIMSYCPLIINLKGGSDESGGKTEIYSFGFLFERRFSRFIL
jgi:hypothetical protein